MKGVKEEYRKYGDTCSGVYPPEEYEGLWVERWPNGQVKFRGEYGKRHMRIGQHICFFENGVLQEVSFWDYGYACGTLMRFREDGTKYLERDFGQSGGRDRSWTERFYNSDSELYSMKVWKDNDIVTDWVEPVTQALMEEINGESIVAEAIRKVYPDK